MHTLPAHDGQGETRRKVRVNDKNLDVRKSTKNLHPNTAISLGAIEPGILGLVIALNKVSGVSTMASCHGHGRAEGLFTRAVTESTPYVLFRAKTEFAQELSKSILEGKSNQRLHFNWHLRGYFHPSDNELAWFIEPYDVGIAAQWDTRNTHQWDRAKVDDDLATLADIVKHVSALFCA
jgi:hypothetical protein